MLAVLFWDLLAVLFGNLQCKCLVLDHVLIQNIYMIISIKRILVICSRVSINLLVCNLVLQHFHSFHLEHYRKSVVVLDCTVVEALFDTVGVVLADIDFVQPTHRKN